jgi:hypothetical protein
LSASSYITNSTLKNYYNKTDSDGRYLQLSGGTIVSNTAINVANANFTISSMDKNQFSNLYFGTPLASTGAYKTATIAEGMTYWSRPRLHFCLNGVSDNTRPTQNAGLKNIRMTILPNGNVGIGSSRPSTKLDVNGNTTTQSLTTTGNIDCGG